jgi:hypothetical protein
VQPYIAGGGFSQPTPADLGMSFLSLEEIKSSRYRLFIEYFSWSSSLYVYEVQNLSFMHRYTFVPRCSPMFHHNEQMVPLEARDIFHWILLLSRRPGTITWNLQKRSWSSRYPPAFCLLQFGGVQDGDLVILRKGRQCHHKGFCFSMTVPELQYEINDLSHRSTNQEYSWRVVSLYWPCPST